jgi:hypothetical protein
MPVQIRRWLEIQGFERNPFEYYEADREELLASYFVEPEWFEALRGDPRQPASAVLFAPRGYGKTSQRLQIARLCGLEAQPPALVVQITDYKWLPADLRALTARDYLRHIADHACRQLWERCQSDPEPRQRFQAHPDALLRLHALRYWATPPAYRIRLPEPALAPETIAELARALRLPAATCDARTLVEQFAGYYEGLTDSDLQTELLELARLGGFVSLYILLDRTDEDQRTIHNPMAVLERLQPLISDLPVIEHPGYAFKFFLPDALESLFAERRIGRVGERPPPCGSNAAQRRNEHTVVPGRAAPSQTLPRVGEWGNPVSPFPCGAGAWGNPVSPHPSSRAYVHVSGPTPSHRVGSRKIVGFLSDIRQDTLPLRSAEKDVTFGRLDGRLLYLEWYGTGMTVPLRSYFLGTHRHTCFQNIFWTKESPLRLLSTYS